MNEKVPGMYHGEGEERYHTWQQSGCGPPESSHIAPVSSTWLYDSGTRPIKYKKIVNNGNYQIITGLVQIIKSPLFIFIKLKR